MGPSISSCPPETPNPSLRPQNWNLYNKHEWTAASWRKAIPSCMIVIVKLVRCGYKRKALHFIMIGRKKSSMCSIIDFSYKPLQGLKNFLLWTEISSCIGKWWIKSSVLLELHWKSTVILGNPTKPETWKVSYYLEIRTAHSSELIFYLDNKFKKERSDIISSVPSRTKDPKSSYFSCNWQNSFIKTDDNHDLLA